jgi:mono/diheme cytochrome c family protein
MFRVNWIHIVLIAILVLIALLFIRLHGAAAQVPAQDVSGDPSSGRRLAEAWCTECHSVELKLARKARIAPDFTAIAKQPSTTALSLNVFLRSNHRSMPNFIIERGDADDIVAYILSLKYK